MKNGVVIFSMVGVVSLGGVVHAATATVETQAAASPEVRAQIKAYREQLRQAREKGRRDQAAAIIHEKGRARTDAK